MDKGLKKHKDDIVTIKDVNDLTFGKVLVAVGIGALLSDKLKKAAQVLIIGGTLMQLPVALRIAKRARKVAKQMKEEQAVQTAATEEQAPTAIDGEQPVEEAALVSHEFQDQQLDGEPASHAQEDPDN